MQLRWGHVEVVEIVQGRLMWGLVVSNVHPLTSIVIGMMRASIIVLHLHGG